jgi:hypothetical protein
MSNVEALIAEVRNDFKKYSEAGLIDQTSLYRDIEIGLKRFGNDIMEVHETVLEVKEGYAKLPNNFFSLYIAYECEPLFFKTNDVVIDDLQNSYIYKERVTTSNKWKECDSCTQDQHENIIRENLYFRNQNIEFYYYKPKLLSLGRTFKKNACHSNCRNKYVRDNPNEIVIIGTTLQANFKEGDIYMQYYGLPVDENGNIDIPETKNGHLETYLEYYLKRRIAERLLGNNDALGLSNMYSVYKREEQVSLRKASSELKLTNIRPSFSKRIKRLNRLESLQYESSLTW